MKLLLYCTKAKPYLVKRNIFAGVEPSYFTLKENAEDNLNGKVVAECDFEVEEIINYNNSVTYYTQSLNQQELLNKSCLGICELDDYLKGKNDYAIHIKNLHIFDEPKELSEYSKRIGDGFQDFQVLGNAPQNMMKCCEIKYMIEDYILISIQPQWMCLILNKEKTIEVRKKVLKEMLKNG